jgi:hypothetical protein
MEAVRLLQDAIRFQQALCDTFRVGSCDDELVWETGWG